MTFSDLGVSSELITALASDGIVEPTAVQIKSAGILAEGKDVFICSETGTGKTLAYLLPLLGRIDMEAKTLQVIVLAPTHELCIQVHDQIGRLVQQSGLPLRSQLLIGETPLKRQLEKLKKKPQVVVGSPGRVLELIKSKRLKVHTVKSIVIDELDRLLRGESLETVRAVIKSTLKERQLIFVSATEQKEVVQEATSLSAELVHINARSGMINPNIEHFYYVEEERKKIDALRKLLNAIKPGQAIVFVHRNERVDVLTQKLEFHKVLVSTIHKEYTKLERKKALDDFRSGRSSVLISSDISSRGMDIKGISHIINLDVPTNSDDYVHRVGRTGRAGAAGCAISLTAPQQVVLMQKHAKNLNIKIVEITLKNGKIEKVDQTADALL